MKRLWGIRHVRFFFLSYRVWRHAQMWAEMGIGLGQPNESDLKHLDDVLEGRA